MKTLCFLFAFFVSGVAMATPLTDAITITSATSGQVIAIASVNVASLTSAQKTALVNFVSSLGSSWPGQASNIFNIYVSRVPGSPSTVMATVTGYIVHADAPTAVSQLTSGATSGIVGIVP